MGGHALAPEIANLKYKFESLREVFDHAPAHEIAVSRAISNLADFCFKEKDFATFQFLQWYSTNRAKKKKWQGG